jgi:hypothetical protein
VTLLFALTGIHVFPRPKYYVPRNPFPSQPYYPQQPLAVLSSPALYSQLDVETLFFVFYYLPGTYMQCVVLFLAFRSFLTIVQKVFGCQGAEAAIVAIPRKVSHMVPETL